MKKQIELNNQEKQVAKILLVSINTIGTRAYGDIAAEVKPAINPHTQLPNMLGNVSILCHERGLPLLSACAVSKDSNMASDGYYRLHCEIFPEAKTRSKIEVWKEELNKIRLWDDWTPLTNYLGIEYETIISPKQREANIMEPVFADEIELVEGEKTQVTINHYERNPIARKKCIEHFGCQCGVCGIDFGEMYGKRFEGKIHVHHINPVHLSEGETIVDPIKDLIPVCPNCHMIIHSKKDGIYSIDTVKGMIRRASKERT